MDEVAKQSGRARLLITIGVMAWLIFAAGVAFYFFAPSDSSSSAPAEAPAAEAAEEEAEAGDGPSEGASFNAASTGTTTSSLDSDVEDTIVNIGRRILEGDEEEEASEPPASAPPAAAPTPATGAGGSSLQAAIIPVSAFFVSLFSSLTSFYFALSAHRRAQRARANPT